MLGVTMDGNPVSSYVIQTLEGTRYLTFDAAIYTTRHVVVTLAAPAAQIGSITDTDPVELGTQATVNSIVTISEGSIQDVTLHLISPETGDHAMSRVGVTDQYTASFTPSQLGTYSYRVIATNSEGTASQSAVNTFTVVDTHAPVSQLQSQSSNAIENGGSVILLAQGQDIGGLARAILSTDETGTWQDFDWQVSNWWDHDWAHRRMVTVAETASLTRSHETVDLLVSSADFVGLSSCVNELRVADENHVEVPSQVYGEQVNDGLRTCHLLFQATVGAGASRNYYIYYGNTAATAPTYTTDLTVIGTGVRTIQNTYFNLNLDTTATAGIISRIRLPLGQQYGFAAFELGQLLLGLAPGMLVN